MKMDVQLIDPTLTQMGALIGLLEEKDGSLSLNRGWFENPIKHINQIPTDRGDEIVKLLQGLMGSTTGNALGTSVESENGNTQRRWYPIQADKDDQQSERKIDLTGLYIVSEQDRQDKNKLKLGLGLLKNFPHDAVVFTPYVLLPIVHLPPEEGQTVFSNSPIEMGMTLTRQGGFGEKTDPVSFDGLKISAYLYLADKPPGLEIVLLNLKLPGRKPANVSLVELIQKTIDKDQAAINEWITIGVSLLTTQLAKVIDAAQGNTTARQIANMTVDLLALLGITGQSPAIDWQKIFQQKPDFKKVIDDWFIQIAGTPSSMKAWLNELFSLFKGELADPDEVDDHVRGAGTRGNPWSIEMLDVKDSVTLHLTFAVEKAPGRPFYVYPGVSISSAVLQPIENVSQLGVCVQSSVELFRMSFNQENASPQPSEPPRATSIEDFIFPAFEVRIKTLNPEVNQPLIAIGENPASPDTATDDNQAAFRLDTIEVGFGYGEIKNGNGRVFSPRFRLTNVQSAIGAWPVIDFRNFSDVIQVAEQALSSIIKEVIKNYLGDEGSRYATSLLVALGIEPPQGTPNWPIDQFLLSAESLDLLVQNPLAALGSYYTRALSTEIPNDKDAKPVYAWQTMLPDIVRLLSGLNIEASNVQGTGSANDPWLAPLITKDPKEPNVLLQTWMDTDASKDQKPQLHLGLKIDVPIILADVRIDTGGELDFINLQLPDDKGSGQFGAQWLPRVAGYIEVRSPADNEPLATPKLAGVSLEADRGLIVFGWGLAQGVFFAAKMLKIAITAEGLDKLAIGDLIFELGTKPWSEENLTAFAKIAVYIAGLSLLELGGRFGLLATSTLGLLPNLPSIIKEKPDNDLPFEVPAGVVLPQNFPKLDVTHPATFFTQPWTDLKKHMAALFASAENVRPLLQIWGWAMTEKVPPVPEPFPSGSFSDPWSVKFENLWDSELLIWAEKAEGNKDSPAAIGIGMQCTMTAESASDIQLEVVAALKAFRIPLNGVQFETKNTLPAFSVAAHLKNSNPGEPLVKEDHLNIKIDRVEMGLQADLSSLEVEGLMAPLLVFKNAKVGGRDLGDVYLQPVAQKPIFTSSGQMPDLEKLLNALLNKLSDTLLENASRPPLLHDVLLLLKDMGLVQSEISADNQEKFSINPAAWQALLANPGAYLRSRMNKVLDDAEKSAQLWRHLRSLLGLENLTLPPALSGLPAVLVALDLIRPAASGYGILLSNWLSLFKAPVHFMENRAAQLLKDADLRKKLITELSHLPAAPLNVPLSLRVISGAKIRIATSAEAPIQIGSELALVADVNFDLENLILEVQGGIDAGAIGSAVVFRDTLTLNPDLSVTNTLQVLLQASPDVSPAPFNPLVFYPLPDDHAIESFLTELGQRLPLQILSYIASKYINQYVLTQEHPIAIRLFEDIGLAKQIGNNHNLPQVTSLTRVLKNPLEWFLSPEVIGRAGGGIDLNKVGKLLSDLPEPKGTQGPAGIVIRPQDSNGLEIANLPYGLALDLSADETSGIRLGVKVDYPPQPGASASLGKIKRNVLQEMKMSASAGLACGLGDGVKVDGSVGLKFILNQDGTYVELDSAYQQDQFELDIKGALNGQNPKNIQLVPFGGFNQFIPSAKEGGQLLDYAAAKLSGAYEEYKKSADRNTKLITLVDEVVTVADIFGIKKAGDMITTVATIQQDPLKWLSEPFGTSKIEKTLAAINKLFTLAKLKGFKQKATVLQYTPAIGSDIGTVSIEFGTKTRGQNDDRKEVLGIWVNPRIQKSWLFLEVTAGVGALLPFTSPGLDFSLSTVLGTDFEAIQGAPLARGPQVNFSIDFDTKSGIQPPSLGFLPLGRPAEDSVPAPMVNLLPNLSLAFSDAPQTPVKAGNWLLRFGVQFLVPLAVDNVLQIDAVHSLLTRPLIDGQEVSFAKVLNKCRLISPKPKAEPERYQLNDIIATYGDMSIEKVVATFAYGTLSSFLEGQGSLPLVKFPQGSINLVGAEAQDKTGTDYGLNVQISDIVLTGKSSPNQQNNQNPNGGSVELVLQLGKWLQYEKAPHTWLKRSYPDWPGSQPGMTFYLVNAKDAENIAFKLQLELASIGMDIRGQNQAPLVNYNGFRLGALEPRLYFTMGVDLQSQRPKIQNIKFGGAMRADGLGIPLGPGFGKVADTKDGKPSNPVAQNLLSSSSSEPGGGNNKGEPNTNAVNPSFSMALGYVSAEKFDLSLYDDKKPDEPTDMITLPVQRKFGPVQVRKFGIGWQNKDKLAKFLFDGGVGLLGLHVDLIDLTIGIPVTHPDDFGSYALDLAGLDISFQGGPVTISGGFLKTQSKDLPYPEHSGLGVISAASFGLTAIGSYTTLKTADDKLQPSLTIFAMLAAPLGGVPAFFVTGIAAGFGINRAFIPPAIDEVEKFPMIAGLADPGQLGGGQIKDVLEKLHDNLPPRLGVYWLAAGLRFTSFELIQGLALAVVEFGKEFEVALLGLASIQLPKKGLTGTTPYVYAELGIRILFMPLQGEFSVSAVLTPNSHLLDPNCRLTGGFAFCIWYPPNANAGDFVLSIGGYGPGYNPPAHYPSLDPVGFNWHVSRTVLIKGGAYFALTPRSIMAGGRLEALFHSGGLKAWFTAHADFFISWKPFHYYISVGINVGVSYTFKIIVTTTLKVELGVDLKIWGPRMKGEARVSLWVISFTIPFGSGDASKDPAKAIDWESFDRYFLPQPAVEKKASQPGRQTRRLRDGASVPVGADSEVCRPAILKGLVKNVYVNPDDNTLSDQPSDDTLTVWIVRGDGLNFSSQTVVPATEIQFDSKNGTAKQAIPADNDTFKNIYVGIRPMATGRINSYHRIGIHRLGEDGKTDLGKIDISGWQARESRSAVPAALWDSSTNVSLQPKDTTLPNRLVGLAGFRPQTPDIGEPIEVATKKYLAYQVRATRRLPLGMSTPTNAKPAESGTSLDTIENTVMRPDVVANRQAVLGAIIAGGTNVATDGRLDVLAANAQYTFAGSPLLGRLADKEAVVQADAGRHRPIKAATRAVPGRPTPTPPRLNAVMRRYASPRQSEYVSYATGGLKAAPGDHFKVPFYAYGQVYSLHPFGRSQSGKVVRWAAAPSRAGTDAPRQKMVVEVGKTFVWDIDSREEIRRSVHFDQNIPVRVTTFDSHGALIDDQNVSDATYRLPPAAAQVLLTGLAPDADPNTVGWHSAALLVQANPVALLGEGVVIRPQAPHVTAHGRYRAAVGLKAARALIRDNTVETLDGGQKQGWISTLMPATVNTLVLSLRRKDHGTMDPNEVSGKYSIRLSRVDSGDVQTESISLKDPIKIETNAASDEVYATYKVPAAKLEGQHVRLRVFVSTRAGWLQTGLFGLTAKPTRAERRIKLPDYGYASEQSLELESTVELS